MTLSELSELQESDEDVWGTPYMAFEIEARTKDDEELVHRRYVFNYATEWDKWTFTEFEEKRTENTDRINGRNWRRTRHDKWDDPSSADVSVPPEVTSKLEEMLDADQFVLQEP